MKTSIKTLENIAVNDNDIKLAYAFNDDDFNAFTDAQKKQLAISYLIENEIQNALNNEIYTVCNDTMYTAVKTTDYTLNTAKTLTVYSNANENKRLLHLYRKKDINNKFVFDIVVTTEKTKLEQLKTLEYLNFNSNKKTVAEKITSDKLIAVIKQLLAILDNE